MRYQTPTRAHQREWLRGDIQLRTTSDVVRLLAAGRASIANLRAATDLQGAQIVRLRDFAGRAPLRYAPNVRRVIALALGLALACGGFLFTRPSPRQTHVLQTVQGPAVHHLQSSRPATHPSRALERSPLPGDATVLGGVALSRHKGKVRSYIKQGRTWILEPSY